MKSSVWNRSFLYTDVCNTRICCGNSLVCRWSTTMNISKWNQTNTIVGKLLWNLILSVFFYWQRINFSIGTIPSLQVALPHVTSHHIITLHCIIITPHHITLQHNTSPHIMSHVTSYHVTSGFVTSRHDTSQHVTSRQNMMSHHITSSCSASRHIKSHYDTSRYVTLQWPLSRHITLCHVTSYQVASCHSWLFFYNSFFLTKGPDFLKFHRYIYKLVIWNPMLLSFKSLPIEGVSKDHSFFFPW